MRLIAARFPSSPPTSARAHSDGLPKMEKIVAEINKFLTVKNDGVETVQKDERKAPHRET